MSSSRGVRRARFDLALALIDAERSDAAVRELREALKEAGDDPPEWRIHLELGLLAERVGDQPVEAFSELVSAATGAPPPDADDPSAAALQMLESTSGRWLASKIDDSQVRALVQQARRDDANPGLVRLAAQTSFLRGDAQATQSLISNTSEMELQADPVLGSARAVAQALQLLDEGAFEEALLAIDDGRVPAEEPTGASARALALFGLGRLEEALRALDAAPDTFDTCVARALVWLTTAANDNETERPAPIAHAEEAATMAARLEPSLGDGLLLRAQITLEGTLELDRGRRLLETALRRLEGDPDRARLWRLQRRVRTDDIFRYITLEVAAACENDADLLAIRREELPFATTTYHQDAAIAELAAKAMQDAGRDDMAAEMFAAAAQFYTSSQEPANALQARERQRLLAPTTELLIQLADDRFVASYTAEQHGRDALLAEIAQGLAALDELDGSMLEQSRSERVQAAYLRGLLLKRRAEDVAALPRERWLALPWLLVAAIDDQTHSYRAAHLAWGLWNTWLFRSALHYGDRAFALEPDDTWIQAGAVIMRLNWHGILDEETDSLIDNIDDVPWGNSIRLIEALNRNDIARAQERIDTPLSDELWARQARAIAVARLRGIEAAEPLYRAIFEEAEGVPGDHDAACDAALALGDLDAAHSHIEAGVANRTILPSRAQRYRSFIDLINGEEGAVDALRGLMAAFVRPVALRGFAYCDLPVLSLAWAERTEVAAAMMQLQEECGPRIDEVAAATLPALAYEMETGRATSTDPDLDRLVHQLLLAEESGELSGEDADRVIGLLDGELPAFKDAAPGVTRATAQG